MDKKHSAIFFLFLFFSTFVDCNSNEKNHSDYTHDSDSISHTPSIENHIKKFRSDMKQIEKQEVEEMVRIVRKKLHSLEAQEGLHNIDKTNQVVRSAIVDYVGKKAYQEAKNYTEIAQIHDTIQNLIETKIITQLGKITGNLTGNALHQFFGEERKNMIETTVQNLTYYYQQTYNTISGRAEHTITANTLPVPPAPPMPQNNVDYYIKQHQNQLSKELQSSLLKKDLTINDFKRLNNFIAESVTYISHIKPDDFMAHVRCALEQMLDENLEQCRKYFSPRINIDQNKLIKSINEARNRIIITIEELQYFNQEIVFSLLENNLKKEIIKNYIRP